MTDRPKSLYLHPLAPNQRKQHLWYARRPVGIHTIEGFVKKIMTPIQDGGTYTPHSLRATKATRLYAEGVTEQLIQEQTGHSSLAVRGYKRSCTGLEKSTPNRMSTRATQSTAIENVFHIQEIDLTDEFEPTPTKRRPPAATISKPPTTWTAGEEDPVPSTSVSQSLEVEVDTEKIHAELSISNCFHSQTVPNNVKPKCFEEASISQYNSKSSNMT